LELIIGNVSSVILQPGEKKCFVCWIEESAISRERDDEEVCEKADSDGDTAFNYKDPGMC
jgi:hypothetical protein